MRNNPPRFVDPSGLTALIACGTGQRCESGRSAAKYRNAIIREWVREGRYPGANRAFLNWVFDKWFLPALAAGFNGKQSAEVFGVVFRDVGAHLEAIKDRLGGWGDVGPFLEMNRLFGARGADLWIGYSQGGAVVVDALRRAYREGLTLPRGAILIEPRIEEFSVLEKDLLGSVRVVTWSDEDPSPLGFVGFGVRGWVLHESNFRSDDCGGFLQHCVHEKWQTFMVDVARTPPGPGGDAAIRRAADAMGVDVFDCRG